MTVTYTAQVATCRGLGCFWKLLFRWHGSIYKLLWPNLLVYAAVYFGLSILYRFVLNDEYRILFEKIALHCQQYGDLIPIAFVLGFYVSIVIKRWWDQYMCMPWPDNLAMFVSTLVHGQDDRGRLMRRTIIRYVNLCLVITLRMMSPRVKKRFPTMDHLVEAGFLQPNEKKIFEDLDQKTSHPKYWMPLVWAGGIMTRARKEGRIKDDHSLKTLIDGLNIFRSGCGGMLNYDWISIPLVYTQVVTLAVYTYFMATLMGNQFLDPKKEYPKHEVDLVFPVFTFLQFFFYMGWLKVAESLVNPFGEDDDDFELNWLVDRNLQVSYVIVDEMHQEHPEMVKDQYWDEIFPSELPYTVASKQYQSGPPLGSADNVEVSLEQAEFMPLETVNEEAQDDVEDLNDIDLDVEAGERTRHETHPMKIITRQKTSSSGSINTSSYSGPRGIRKSSVLNMLTKMFRREESNRDLGEQSDLIILPLKLFSESNMGSSISLPSRRGIRSSSRMSSMSQAQSRTSIPRINTFQRQSAAGEEDLDTEETSQLISWNKDRDSPRKLSKEQAVDEESKPMEIQMDATSEGSGNSVQTSFFRESWSTSVDPSESGLRFSPQQKISDFPRQTFGKSVKRSEWKDSGAISPLITFTDPYGATEPLSSGPQTQIIIPSSVPIKHMFSPVGHPNTPVHKEIKSQQSNSREDTLLQLSSLSRSLQQQSSEKSISKSPVKQVPTLHDINDAVISSPGALSSSISKAAIDATVITILSPAAHFEHAAVEGLPITPSVSLPSVLVPTTSVVTMPSTGMAAVSVSPAITAPLSCTIVTEKQPDIPRTGSEGSTAKVLTLPTLQASPPKVVIMETVGAVSESAEQPQSPPPGGPPYVPSAAIPVPSVSPAHVPGSSDAIDIEAAVVPLARRTHHDFHELETISEHGETATDSPFASIDHKEETTSDTDVEKPISDSMV
ncbi:hypothetical protein C0J52_08231 [Blattella germanica]|nr:hypothetical protein C0J52_08231 [Blattella germanica]